MVGVGLQQAAHPRFAAFVMLAHRADADFHDSGGFAQSKILVKDEVEHLGLPRRQLRESGAELQRLFV